MCKVCGLAFHLHNGSGALLKVDLFMNWNWVLACNQGSNQGFDSGIFLVDSFEKEFPNKLLNWLAFFAYLKR